jgi:quercetin dioxygenase-like cupin family protein
MAEHKSLQTPDETRTPPLVELRLVTVGPITWGHMTAKPGWKWSEHVKPIAGTELCEAEHNVLVLQGEMIVTMKDGTELHLKPGDVAYIPPGHDAVVLSGPDFVGVDVTGMAHYAE